MSNTIPQTIKLNEKPLSPVISDEAISAFLAFMREPYPPGKETAGYQDNEPSENTVNK